MLIRMRIARTVLALAAAVLFSSGCSPNVIKKDLQIKPDAKTGLVLLSGTFTGVPTESLHVSYRPVGSTDTTKYRSLIIRNPYLEPDFGPKESVRFLAQSNPGGRLAYMELAPGKYEFFHMDGFELGRKISAMMLFSIPFEVSAGRVVYVGNIHFHVPLDSMSFNTSGLVGWNPKSNMAVLDRRERDLELLRKQAPLISPGQIDVKISSIAKAP